MTCPDLEPRWFVHWLFDFAQIAYILGAYELVKFLWRKIKA